MKIPITQPEGTQKKVLVVGDWIFDEHWVTGTHRSTTSSRIGHEHLRALHAHDNALYGLCGAAGTASILRHATKAEGDGGNPFQVLGAGIWDPEDTEALWAMVNEPSKAQVYQSPYRIVRGFDPAQQDFLLKDPLKDPPLLNFGAIIVESMTEKRKRRFGCGTLRVVRIYRHTESKLELLTRIDWAPHIPEGKTAWIRDDERVLNTLKSKLQEFLQKNSPKNSPIDAVVLHDMNKGGISKDLVKILVEVVPRSAEWFVAAKTWRQEIERPDIENAKPDWLSILPRSKLKLLPIPQPAARRMVEEGEISCWMAKYGVPSDDALTIMDKLSEHFNQASIVVLPDSFSILARDMLSPESPAANGLCVIQTDPRNSETQYGDDESEGVGLSLTSVLFPSIVAQMLSLPPLPLKDILPAALIFTNRRMKEEDGRIKRPEDSSSALARDHFRIRQLKQDLKQDDDACKELARSTRFNKTVHIDDCGKLRNEWKKSFEGLGILEGNPDEETVRRIEPWRAMTEVKGYVTCVRSKRDAIRDILREATAFRHNPRQHRSLMVVASPGSGKTHLVNKLADAQDFALLRFDITQMLSKKDLLDVFDDVATEKLKLKEKNLLVFVDEINALLEAQHVYEAFLAPIEEGVYIRGGRTFHIDPCLWLFAGTEDPSKQGGNSSKGRDFVSRLSRAPLELKSEDGESLRTERVYLGVCMLRAQYPDVRKVSEKALLPFAMLKPNVEIREIGRFVKEFVDIQNGHVMSWNVPFARFQGLMSPDESEKWKEEREGDLIEISDRMPKYMDPEYERKSSAKQPRAA